jgi:hypothetical protein
MLYPGKKKAALKKLLSLVLVVAGTRLTDMYFLPSAENIHRHRLLVLSEILRKFRAKKKHLVYLNAFL